MNSDNPFLTPDHNIARNIMVTDAIIDAWTQLQKAKPAVIHTARTTALTEAEPLRFTIEGVCCDRTQSPTRCVIRATIHIVDPRDREES